MRRILAALAVLLLTSPALAQEAASAKEVGVVVCNRAGQTVYIAYANFERWAPDDSGPLYRSRGWRVVEPGNCTTLWQWKFKDVEAEEGYMKGVTGAHHYYFYAQGQNGAAWSGTAERFCTPTSVFDITGAHEDCTTRGYRMIDMSVGDRMRTGYTFDLVP